MAKPPLTLAAFLVLAIHVPKNLGYLALAALVAGETMGVPLPGETALIVGGVLASKGHLQIERVIAVAAAAAIVGDNVGFWIGRRGGRWLLELPGPLEHHRARVLARGEEVFRRHGGKTVFFGRWFSGLRIASAWLAGVNRMSWPRFLAYNAAGGIGWATSVGLLAYWVGDSAKDLLGVFGVAGLVALAVAIVAVVLWRRRRATRTASGDSPRDG
ncbi:MAG: DedA family protein [Actinobacteria bacterium]|nr:DedA family protein [Actinomycetota bacterium]